MGHEDRGDVPYARDAVRRESGADRRGRAGREALSGLASAVEAVSARVEELCDTITQRIGDLLLGGDTSLRAYVTLRPIVRMSLHDLLPALHGRELSLVGSRQIGILEATTELSLDALAAGYDVAGEAVAEALVEVDSEEDLEPTFVRLRAALAAMRVAATEAYLEAKAAAQALSATS